MADPTSFQALLEGYFLGRLISGRGVSSRTVESYRDTFLLYLRWMDDEGKVPPRKMDMDSFAMDAVERFLAYLAEKRGNSPKTVNCRLAAIRSFCRYVTYKDPTRLAQVKAILHIPQRKERRAELSYLDSEEIGWLIGACSATTRVGCETRLLIRLLYNSGARISEILSLKARDVAPYGDSSCRIAILGKGRKERTLPLWPETAAALMAHIEKNGIAPGQYLFAGKNVEHLTRSGARSRISNAAKAATAEHPSLAAKNITAHAFRHSTAMSMLASGIDTSTIAIWLGHEGIQTTHRYMIADMKLKEEAISKVHADWGDTKKGRYKADAKTVEFLASL